MWGNKQKELVPNLAKFRSKLVVSGHPRFELLDKKFHSLYTAESNSIEEKFGDFILINTNMGFGNNIDNLNEVRKATENGFTILMKRIKFDRLKTESVISLASYLADNFDYKIITGPTPENKSVYSQDF